MNPLIYEHRIDSQAAVDIAKKEIEDAQTKKCVFF